MKVSVSHSLDGLERDQREILRRAPGELRNVVVEGIRAGNELAKGYARTKNGPKSTARKYPGTFRTEIHGAARLAAVSIYSGEYGPVAQGQGQLAHILEQGKGNNAPQNNLARSTDIIGPAFAKETRDLLDGWFWS